MTDVATPTDAQPRELSTNEVLLEIIQQSLITPYFQPIVDMYHDNVLGYEMLSRGVAPLESAQHMFEQARQMGLCWYLERVARTNTFYKIRELCDRDPASKFFVNVSPVVFNDARFLESFGSQVLDEFGLDLKRVVIEITEEAGQIDYTQFQNRIRHYAAEGFKISLDDFGTGASSLVMLVAVMPHFLKLDKSIVRDIHKFNYKQLVLRTLVSFASGVDTKLIAEGVENAEELDVLIRLGIRYAQGFMFARPSAEPPEVSPEAMAEVRRLIRKYSYAKVELDQTIVNLVDPASTVQRSDLAREYLETLFHNDRTLDHVVILDGESIFGLATRGYYNAQFLGTHPTGGSEDHRNDLCKTQPLVVEDHISVTALAKMAMSRCNDDLYDPILVTDRHKRFVGTVTMKHLISRSAELEVNQAYGANPLTKLPGNRAIQGWIQDALNQERFTVIYGDLGRFKEYNDAYGFIMGDEVICLTARVLSDNLHRFGVEARLGHIGGDDFVIVCSQEDIEHGCRSICQTFDTDRLKYFHPADAERGFYRSKDRQGHQVDVPLVSLSLAVITSESFHEEPHPAQLAEIAASLKKQIKQKYSRTAQSGFMVERRQYDDE
jgi:EAL domain-containing protein (putative c-di-GMP-specific phosphodiesterase class I)/GGDEF domain-containing protein